MNKVKEFYEAAVKDEALKAKLEEANKAYEGKKLSQEERVKAFESSVLPIAKKAGYEFTMDDVKAYEESLKSTSGELNDDELENVAGGALAMECICAIWGSGQYVEQPDGSSKPGSGWGLCGYIGTIN